MSEGSSQSASTQAQSIIWQTRLHDACRNKGIRPPVFQECSDRRGGRTAWSSIVEVQGVKHQARYWYDGTWINNAREDAAEVALQFMHIAPKPTLPTSTPQGARV